MATVAIIHAAEDTLPARALAEKLRAAKLSVQLELPPGEELREAVKGMADAEKDRRQFAEWDLRFHLTVCAASKNPFFQSFAAMIELRRAPGTA